jgi:membrane protease YdiL (CAAX protease family)
MPVAARYHPHNMGLLDPINPDPKEHRTAWRAIVLFVLITVLLSAVFEGLMARIGSTTHYLVMGVMWCPGMAAMLACLVLKRDVRALPWRWAPAKWILAAWLLPMGYGMAVYLPVWLLSLGGSGFGNPATLAQWSQEVLGKGPTNLGGALFYLFLLATLGVVTSAANTLGEEIGWRGFLVWEMRKVMPFWMVGLGSGLFWAIWHYPGILWTNYSAGEGSHWLQIALFTASIAPMGVVFAYFAFRTNSLWPAVILHASHNCLIQRVYTPLTVKGPGTHLYIDEFGCLLPVASIALAVYFLRRAKAEGLA